MPSIATLRSRELSPEAFIPYVRHIDETTIALDSRSLMVMIALEGVSFETADVLDLNALHRDLNTLYRNIADERLALWTHLIRRRDSDYPDGTFATPFSAALNEKYRERMVREDLFRNDLYLTVLWSPARDPADKAAKLLSRLRRARHGGFELDEEALKQLQDKVLDIAAGLKRFEPRVLSLYDQDGMLFSEPSEVLHQIVGGRRERVPLTEGRIASAIYSDRVIIGRETIEIRHEAATRFAGMLSFKEYPARTRAGMLDGVLTSPFELMLSQSFSFVSKADARVIMGRKQNQMVSSGDKAASQIDELDDAMDDLESNRFAIGEHHLTLSVFASTVKELTDNLAKARASLTNGGAVVAREDLGLEAAWWAQLPGNFRYRARSGAITSKNFAALSPFHSYPIGQKDGNEWGPAVALLKTASGSPYYFNLHYGDLGNTFMCGPSGAGKTVIVNFMLSQLEKHDPHVVFFDKDRGADLYVRAAGGTYLPLKNGVPTGCAPLKALDLTPENKVFLARWVGKLVGSGTRELTVTELRDISGAIDGLADLPVDRRTIGALRTFLNNTDPEGIAARLRRWERGGPLGWVFDNVIEDIGFGDFGGSGKFIGYDMTDFLDNEEIRTPLMAYLFHRVEQLIDGRRIIIVIDEFWKALQDEGFRDLAQNKLKTIRKQNGLMLFATQSPRDALISPIAHTIIEQCPTQIFLPNSRGSHADYVEGFKLTEREYELIARELSVESRRFVLKQGHNSVVAELDLNGFDDELAILSGRTANVELLDAIRAEVGNDVKDWLPIFQQRRSAS
ncbi:VirB4 family type IV secretion/conjugal transfer ATPase (plasmid) [Agrobacterium tumefaciens]|uniref:Type IV secretion system protein virB4 n=1 Tax=Agrobacterium tumefaciens TaxID=358 RepID=A0AAP9J8Z6_AGRTU|nr:VirB4 family type IV secretion system protein [Agrobacterium tumefaciens]NSZ61108.1 VirB4 family type IV secretion/conjugal transfer ATPase [Agrobacterium tumefaciens]QDY97528.1 VirB4 family type IV secretion/conjugal transfer ATPase [Agrobacterium tumefaciens]UXS12656.1 VirB4 family type IV secretion/conjugal transfer ATPase [Agrobacterium tumefaciens]UXS20017.1 VirB4 family type IV secretion/conjugal transfer ATPase [Agrobacterium tumefaciens]UXS27917.1 VirB4 family type IV secretion/conj